MTRKFDRLANSDLLTAIDADHLKNRGWFTRGGDGTLQTNRDLDDTMMNEVGVRFIAIDVAALIACCEQRQEVGELVATVDTEQKEGAMIRPFKLFTDWAV